MEKKPSLLNQLKSKYILQDILSLAYGDIKSVLKLIKYNKNLINKLDINIKDYYNYKYKKKIQKGKYKDTCPLFLFLIILHMILVFIPYLIYIICFFTIGTFNDKNLKEGYDKKKKSFVDFMDNYILLGYFLFIIISYLLDILLNICSIIYLKGVHRAIYLSIFALVDLFHYVLYIIKVIFTNKIMKKELCENVVKGKTSVLNWFYAFDFALLLLLIPSFLNIFESLMILCENKEFDDIKTNSLLEINGIKINEFKLESEFDGLDEKSKNEFVFNKRYVYELNENLINIINKINDIRKNNNIPELKFDKKEIIPHFMINPKLQLVFHPNENIYKISGNSYIFKYDKDEFQNLLNNNEIINIIKIDYLNEINIVEQNDTEFIFIFNNRPENENRIQENNNIRKPNINIGNINISHIDIINTEDKFVNLSVNEISERDISEKRNISKKK